VTEEKIHTVIKKLYKIMGPALLIPLIGVPE
jgi:hypothetical protein